MKSVFIRRLPMVKVCIYVYAMMFLLVLSAAEVAHPSQDQELNAKNTRIFNWGGSIRQPIPQGYEEDNSDF